MSETILLILALVPALIIAIVFHEVAHGWAALALGDPTAKERRRLSFNPIRHVDPVGTLLVPGFLAFVGGPIFGWAKPVPVNKRRLNNPRFGMMAVAAAGPAMNLLLAAVAAIAAGSFGLVSQLQGMFGMAGGTEPGLAAIALGYFMVINIFLALFNLLPIPPFDGSHIVGGLMPRSMAARWERLQQVGMFLLILLIAVTWAFPNTGIIEHVVLPPVEWLRAKYLSLAIWVAGA